MRRVNFEIVLLSKLSRFYCILYKIMSLMCKVVQLLLISCGTLDLILVKYLSKWESKKAKWSGSYRREEYHNLFSSTDCRHDTCTVVWAPVQRERNTSIQTGLILNQLWPSQLSHISLHCYIHIIMQMS